MIRRPPRSTLFPSPTLSRSRPHPADRHVDCHEGPGPRDPGGMQGAGESAALEAGEMRTHAIHLLDRCARGDRKSTRLNSSHLVISYAVFCLKKKKKKET